MELDKWEVEALAKSLHWIQIQYPDSKIIRMGVEEVVDGSWKYLRVTATFSAGSIYSRVKVLFDWYGGSLKKVTTITD